MNTYHKIHGIFKRHLEGAKKGRFIMGQYSRPDFEMLKDIRWEWTEKIDGTNIRVIWDGNDISFKGKTDRAELPKHLEEKLNKIFYKEETIELFQDFFGETEVCFYGEGYGYKIQKGCKYFGGEKEVGFILFDIKVGKTWLKRSDVMDLANSFNIKVVPYLGRGTVEEAINFVKSEPKSAFGNQDFVMEGLVIRPEVELLDRNGHRIITKIKVKDFREE